jgi:glycosyltransferase involved in cell wall biosynthesis
MGALSEEESIMDDEVKVVAIIPAYDEESSIAKVILQTRQHVDDIVVCDDGSTDMTFMIAKALGVRVVRHTSNQGKGDALRTSSKEIIELNPDVIVTLDGDNQHDPNQIPLLVEPIEKGVCDVVVGSRYVDGAKTDAPLYRRFGLGVINFLYRKLGRVQIRDTQSGFRAYSKKAFEYLIQGDAKGYGIDSEQMFLASRNGLRVMEVPIDINYRGLVNTSKKSPLFHGIDLMSTLFRLVIEERPLKYLGLPGIGLTSLGTILTMYLLWMFNVTRCFNIPVALSAIMALIAGVSLVVGALILHGLKRIDEKLNRFNGHVHSNAEKCNVV